MFDILLVKLSWWKAFLKASTVRPKMEGWTAKLGRVAFPVLVCPRQPECLHPWLQVDRDNTKWWLSNLAVAFIPACPRRSWWPLHPPTRKGRQTRWRPCPRARTRSARWPQPWQEEGEDRIMTCGGASRWYLGSKTAYSSSALCECHFQFNFHCSRGLSALGLAANWTKQDIMLTKPTWSSWIRNHIPRSLEKIHSWTIV